MTVPLENDISNSLIFSMHSFTCDVVGNRVNMAAITIFQRRLRRSIDGNVHGLFLTILISSSRVITYSQSGIAKDR